MAALEAREPPGGAIVGCREPLQCGRIGGDAADREGAVDRQPVGVRKCGVPVFGPPKTKVSVKEVPLPEFIAEAPRMSGHGARALPIAMEGAEIPAFAGDD